MLIEVENLEDEDLFSEYRRSTDGVVYLPNRWDSEFGVLALRFENENGEVVSESKQDKSWIAHPKDLVEVRSRSAISRNISIPKNLRPGRYWVNATLSVTKTSKFMSEWYAKNGDPLDSADARIMTTQAWHGVVKSSRKMIVVGPVSTDRTVEKTENGNEGGELKKRTEVEER